MWLQEPVPNRHDQLQLAARPERCEPVRRQPCAARSRPFIDVASGPSQDLSPTMSERMNDTEKKRRLGDEPPPLEDGEKPMSEEHADVKSWCEVQAWLRTQTGPKSPSEVPAKIIVSKLNFSAPAVALLRAATAGGGKGCGSIHASESIGPTQHTTILINRGAATPRGLISIA